MFAFNKLLFDPPPPSRSESLKHNNYAMLLVGTLCPRHARAQESSPNRSGFGFCWILVHRKDRGEYLDYTSTSYPIDDC